MKTILSLLVLTASVAMAAPMPTLPQADSSWKKMSDSENVLVHSKEVPNSDVVAFRGETIIDASIAKVANVLIDVKRKNEWVFRGVEAKVVREMGQFDRIEYNHTASGFFLVRDRDFVFHANATLDKSKRQMIFTLQSVADASMPEKDQVRGSIDDGRYILTMISPTRTHLVVEIHADPKGNVPKWLVNLFQKSWPTKTLNGIRAQCAKPDVSEHPGVKAYFSGIEASSPTASN